MLKTYDDFIGRVNELGFLSFYGRFHEGFPMLETETAETQWHTGDAETDPWQWKDRAAEEKKLAFGCILNGYKGFVAKDMYPLFYAAYHPRKPMAQRYADGEVPQAVWQLYRLFEGGAVLSTADLRSALGVTKKGGASRADSAVRELQRQFYITVCGNRRKISYEGFEYGWPANTYCTVKAWAPENWLSTERIDPDDARSRILDIGCSIGRNIKRDSLSKVLFNSDIY